MIFNVEVNHKVIEARAGETVLSTLTRNGIKVPTLCSMKDFSPTGACRICVVEVEGKENLVPSCSYPIEEWMKIKTHSPRVISARKTIVELLLSDHPDDCLYCIRNGHCELQKLSEELNIRERRIPSQKSRHKLDHSSPSIVRDPAKCILCGRCVRVCDDLVGASTLEFINRGNKIHIGTAYNKDINFSSCVTCGQCILVCPTGALHERTCFAEIQNVLYNPEKRVVVQCDPAISVSLADEFGFKTGKDINGWINNVLRKIGFDKVFETGFGADLMIMEQVEEMVGRMEKGENLPVFSSHCPAWIKYIEQWKPELLSRVSVVKSPQQIMGSLIKSYYAGMEGLSPEDIFSVSVTPCTAKKFESEREEMTHKGVNDIDAVITTRELAQLIRQYGIDISQAEGEFSDYPFGMRSSAGKIIANTGGTAEAVLRTLYHKLTGNEFDADKSAELRGVKGVKEYYINAGNHKIGIAIVNGLSNVQRLLEEIEKGRNDLHYIEVMACPGGCINGGGQPISSSDKILKARAKALYDTDERDTIKKAHKNPQVLEIYKNFLEDPLNEKNKRLLYTHYTRREVIL